MTTEFQHVIRTEEELRDLIGSPVQYVQDKIVDHIDNHCADFIAESPFVLLGTADADGNADVSPKGDPAGFIEVYNEKTLLIPDRPGNRLADTLTNILQNPNIGMIFLVPGRRETLRVNGTAQLIRDDAQRERFSMNGKPPQLLIAVTVKQAFFHCAKCVVRSNLWTDQTNSRDMQEMAAALVAQAKLEMSVDEMRDLLEEDAKHVY
jgi:PPOX class probable FMN-dependent enzyme